MSRARLVLVAAVLAAGAAVVAPSQAAESRVQEHDSDQQSSSSSQSVRTATEEELRELSDDFDAAWKSKEHAAIAAALERMTAFSNPELLEASEKALGYVASKKDLADAKAEAQALGMGDKGTIEKLAAVRAALVVDAAARVATVVGSDESAALLVKALGSKVCAENPLAIRAVVDGLAAHPDAGRKADLAVREILFSIGADDLSGDAFPIGVTAAPVPGYDEWARHGAAIRYFGRKQSKSLDVALFLAGLLAPPTPVNPDSPDNPPAAYWEARYRAWQRHVRDVVWSLEAITGRRWKSGAPEDGGEAEAAAKFIRENRRTLGLE